MAATCRAWTTALLIFAPFETAMIGWRIQGAPLAWICLLWIFVLLALAVCYRSYRAACVNAASALMAIGLVEALLHLSGPANPYLLPPDVRFVGDLARPNYFIQMPVQGLGYQPRAGMRIVATKMQGSQVIYSVRYSVGLDGLRVHPPAMTRADACLLMFGDSIAWGEGVNDEDTAAYRIGVLSHGAIHVTNFAFTGYSAHQMLWQIDSGIVAKYAGCNASLPVIAIYQTLPNNAGRVAGLRGWDRYGPRYVLASRGEVRYAGSFARGDFVLHDRLFVPSGLAEPLSKVNLYARIVGRDRHLDDFDRERFAAVVALSRQRLQGIYSSIKFLVVVWPDPADSDRDSGSVTGQFIAHLQKRGLEVIRASDIVPELRTDPTTVGIAGDGHPSAVTQTEIARYLIEYVHSL
jgi:hypothetical protein